MWYIKKTWERGDEYFISIKLGVSKIHNAIRHESRARHVFPLRYDCLRHVQHILKYTLLKDPHNWNSSTVAELEEDANCNSSVCK